MQNDDPAFQPLRAAIEAGTEIEIQMRRAGLDQRWRGIVPAINPAMGFINLIAADFHLHLRGGDGCELAKPQEPTRMAMSSSAAIGQDGDPLGLVLVGPASNLWDALMLAAPDTAVFEHPLATWIDPSNGRQIDERRPDA